MPSFVFEGFFLRAQEFLVYTCIYPAPYLELGTYPGTPEFSDRQFPWITLQVTWTLSHMHTQKIIINTSNNNNKIYGEISMTGDRIQNKF